MYLPLGKTFKKLVKSIEDPGVKQRKPIDE